MSCPAALFNVGQIEHVVVPEVKAGRRQRRALDSFNAGNVMGVGLGLDHAGNGRQRDGEEKRMI